MSRCRRNGGFWERGIVQCFVFTFLCFLCIKDLFMYFRFCRFNLLLFY